MKPHTKLLLAILLMLGWSAAASAQVEKSAARINRPL